MPQRPQRREILDETGRPRTLDSGPEAFDRLGGDGPPLFLGLGPEPERLAEWFPEAAAGADFLESPETEAALGPEFVAAIPPNFRRLAPEDVAPERLRRDRVFWFRQGMRLHPGFWGPLWARLGLALGGAGPQQATAWLPGDEQALVLPELSRAFGSLGFPAKLIPDDPGLVPELLRRERPALYFSVNFRGLDPFGETFHLLRQAGVRVAIWCVDNPFHLLTRIKSRFWTQALILVTDHWFVEPLKRLGAEQVLHLPLAADPGFSGDGPLPAQARGLEDRLVFVGRSVFPDRDGFFAGARSAPENLALAGTLLAQGTRPHFGWWLKRLGIDRPWPGNVVRAAGLGADQSGLAWRTLCLRAAGPALTVIGDPGWQELLPGADLRPPVDYYGGLAAVYRHAACSLNITGMLLPSGLTQRHFDVWTAGGFLLTDANPGLDIFPEELVRAVAFARAEELPALFSRLAGDSPEKRALARQWRETILAGHTYAHRAAKVLAAAGLDRTLVSAHKGLEVRPENG